MRKNIILTLFSLLIFVVTNAQNVGIGTTTPNAPFNVAAGKAVLFGIDTTSNGTKLMWLPFKGAFRTGYYSGLNNDTIGSFSTAMGTSEAPGNYSTALGDSYSVGLYSTAMGLCAASGDYSTAMGKGYAEGDYSTGMGNGSASGNYSTAMGLGAAVGQYSTAMGFNSLANGDYSTAMGGFSDAEGQYSTAMGNSTVSFSPNETVVGIYNNNQSNTNRLFEIGDGTATAPSNALTVLNNGNVYIGTVSPTHVAKLVVQGNQSASVSAYAYYALNGTSVFDGTSSDATAPLSIWASDRIAASEFDATSDMRIKRNIEPLPDTSLAMLAKINVVSYTKLSKGGYANEIGVLGQEVEKILPAVVKQSEGDIYNDSTKQWEPVKDFRMVNYQTINMLTTKAVQELNKKVDGQQAMVEVLQKQNTSLQQNNLAQQQKVAQLQQSNLALQQQMQALLNSMALLNKQVQLLAANASNQNAAVVNK